MLDTSGRFPASRWTRFHAPDGGRIAAGVVTFIPGARTNCGRQAAGFVGYLPSSRPIYVMARRVPWNSNPSCWRSAHERKF